MRCNGIVWSIVASMSAICGTASALLVVTSSGGTLEIDYDTDLYQGGVNALNLDVNGDGAADVGFGWRWGPTEWAAIAGGPWADPDDPYGTITPNSLGVVTKSDELARGGSGLAQRFGAGDSIGPGSGMLSMDAEVFLAEVHYVPPNNSASSGDWLGAPVNDSRRRGFVGFAFDIDGSTHWGWVDLTVDHADPIFGFIRIHGWGYETETNVGAAASAIPAPAGAILLVGAALRFVRRRR